MDRKADKFRDIARLVNRGWVTLPQVARMVGVSPMTMRKIHREGKIRAIKVGGLWRVYEDELVRFLTEGNYIEKDPAVLERLQQEEIH